MARRSKEDATERLTAFVGFQVTPAEKAELERRAKATGRLPSDFYRIVLLSDLKAPVPAGIDPAAIRELITAINHVGNNHNQIAKHANERKALPPELDAALLAVSREIMAALEKVIALKAMTP
jgi:hypothetical protein